MKEPRFSHEEPRPNGFGKALCPQDAARQPDDGDEGTDTPVTAAAAAEAAVVTPALYVCTDCAGVSAETNSQKADKDKNEEEVDNDDEHDDQVNDTINDGSSLHGSASASGFPRRAASQRAQALAATNSPGSAFSSPQLAALTDITPLPSPIQLTAPLWLSGAGSTHSLSRTSSRASQGDNPNPNPNHSLNLNTSTSRSSSLRRKPDAVSQLSLGPPILPKSTQEQDHGPSASTSLAAPKPKPTPHARNRSLSEYHPTALHTPQPRQVAGADSKPARRVSSQSGENPRHCKLHREEHLAVQRGLAQHQQQEQQSSDPPCPARISSPGRRLFANDDDDSQPRTSSLALMAIPAEKPTQTYDVRSIRTRQPRKYRRIHKLGEGTFSQVALAVREEQQEETDGSRAYTYTGPPRLVAVKVVEFGPAGGADEERVEVSLKREVDILKSINHPSLVQLKAFGSDKKMALLVLGYCPGGDLFELASKRSHVLVPGLVRRIFAELVAAVRYLHQNLIVHRDIKLENVLVNMTPPDIRSQRDWQTYPHAVVTLTDLGLSRRIPEPPESPLLRTRCGSEDYAAPELTMGQPYDGRSTDAWALAVLLYALLESRLPFDLRPGTRGDPEKLRIRRSHLIARCEYNWFRYGDDDGEWDPAKGKEELEGARLCVEGLLRRSSRRMTLDQVAQTDWVAGAIDVPEGLKRSDRETQ